MKTFRCYGKSNEPLGHVTAEDWQHAVLAAEKNWGNGNVWKVQELDKPSPEKMRVDAYMGTINRLEPDIAMIDASAFYASAAISLKRIADAMQRHTETLHALIGVYCLRNKDDPYLRELLDRLNSKQELSS
jgi:hypothetical protein